MVDCLKVISMIKNYPYILNDQEVSMEQNEFLKRHKTAHSDFMLLS